MDAEVHNLWDHWTEQAREKARNAFREHQIRETKELVAEFCAPSEPEYDPRRPA